MLEGTFPAVKAAAYMVPLCPFPSMAPVSGDQ
jgi:hypothetical protein